MRHSMLRSLPVLALLVVMLGLTGAAGTALAASPSIVATPSALDFGYVTAGQSVSADFRLENVGDLPVLISAVSLTGWPGSLTLAVPRTLQPGEVVRAGPLTFAPSATGRYSSAIELITDDPSASLVTVPVSGKAVAASPSVATIPSAFDFGYVTVGQSVSTYFALMNVSAHSVQISDASLTGLPGFPGYLTPLDLPLTLQPGQVVQTGPLTFRPVATGWYSSAVELVTDDPSSSLVAVPIMGKGAFPTVLAREALPSVVAYGAAVKLSGALTSASGTTLANRVVVLETSTDGTSWSRDAQTTTSSTGTFTMSSPELFSARYVRAEFEGDAEWAPAASTAARVKPRASLGTPVAPSKMHRTKARTVYGALEPIHPARTVVGRLYCYLQVDGRWILGRTCTLRAYADEGHGRYRTRVVLGHAGRWRMRAYHADAGHAPTYSGWRYVTVR